MGIKHRITTRLEFLKSPFLGIAGPVPLLLVCQELRDNQIPGSGADHITGFSACRP